MAERRRTRQTALLAVILPVLALTACGGGAGDTATIAVSGSSTVAPITLAVAREGGFDVDVEAEGTTDGFERFCAGETAINNASTPIPGAGERVDYVRLCADNGVEFVELPIGLDAITVIRNEANTFATDLTVDELRRIWAPGSQVTTWQHVRPEWPARRIGLYGRPAGSGTFEHFTRSVVGEAGEIRDDYATTHDLAELARWLAEDEDGLGFMGVGNYLAADEDYRDRLTNVDVDGVSPTRENAQRGEYEPLSRLLFIYVSTEALQDETVEDFVDYYLEHVPDVLPRVYFYALPEAVYATVRERLTARTTGTEFEGDPLGAVDIVRGLSDDG